MEQLKNIKTLVTLTLTLGLLAGCTSSLSPEKLEAPLKASVNSSTSTVSGTSTPDISSTTDELTTMKMNIAIPYGVLAKPVSLLLNEALNTIIRTKDCDKVGTTADTRPANKQYRCGEIPFGHITSAEHKFIYSLNTPSVSGVSDGTSYWMGAGNTQFYMSRNQRQGSISIDLLDSKTGTQLVPTTNSLGKDLFIRLAPKDGVLDAAACFTLPGSELTSNKMWFPGHISRHVFWFINLDADLSINVDLGKAQFDSAKSCVSIQATYNKQNGVPNIKITGIENPKFENLSLSGFNVRTDTTVTGFLGVVISILDTFGAGIKQTITDAVNNSVRSQFNTEARVTTEQVTSGEWILTMLQHEYLKPLLVDNINTVLAASATSSTDGKRFELPLGQWVGAACLALVDRFAANQTALTLNQLYTVCKGVPDIQLNAFLDDDTMDSKDCYSRYFSVDTLMNNSSIWWNQECAIKNEVVVKAPASMMPFFQCLSDAANSHFTDVNSCKPFIDQLVAMIKDGRLDSYLKSAAAVEPYMSDFSSIVAVVQDIAEQYLGYTGTFTIDTNVLTSIAQALGIVPSMTLDTITGTGSKNLSIINIDVANAKNLLTALIARKKAGTAPDVILLQNINSDEGRKFIKDIAYPYIVMGPAKSGFANDAGIAILSKYNIIQSSTFSYGNSCLGAACNNNQGIIHARIQVDGVPHPIEIINTQFQSKQAAQAVNLQNLLDFTQNKQLVDFAAYFIKNALTDLPLVLGGDFESDANSRIYQQLMVFLKARNGGKECADVVACAIAAGTQRFELWFSSFDHQFIRNSSKIVMKPLQGQRAFKTSDLEALISSGGALEMVYQLSWKP